MGKLLGGSCGNAGYAYAGGKQQTQEMSWLHAELNGWHWVFADKE
jgi:hypothetical protein